MVGQSVFIAFAVIVVIGLVIKYRLKGTSSKNLECLNHPNIIATNSCSICDQPFCDTCISEIDSLNLCEKHLELYKNSQFNEVFVSHSDHEDPESGVRLFEMREDFKKKSIPSYMLVSYSEDEETDTIKTTIRLFALK